MQVYRIAKTKHVNDLSGMGARIAGGRWNEKGTSVLYAAQSRALATVEYLVHVPIAIKPKNLRLATLDIPDSVSQATISIEDLPANWDGYPPPPELAKIGTDWVTANSELMLFVPSAVVLGGNNVIINPSHREMKYVKILETEEHQFDQRLIR
ncbi:MAG: RES family NAD+ phosphorylase [Pirellulaceae bacterium]